VRIHVLSDLHREFSDYQIRVKDADVIVLAGDISTGTRGVMWAKELLEQTSSKVVYVMGNHEAYRENIDKIRRKLRELCETEDRLFFLDNDQVIIDGVRFLGCTLWTDLNLFGREHRLACSRAATEMQDFRLIRSGDGYSRFRPADMVNLFNESVVWLTEKLAEPFNGKTVVVTHHMPSADSVAERFKDDLLSACYASNLDHLFGSMALWCHGHTHDSFDYVKNGTRIVCNPRGYSMTADDAENLDFDSELIVEI